MALQEPPVLAVFLAFFLICTLNIALAASGGVMGGSSFSSDDDSQSSSSYSSSHYSHSYTDDSYYLGRGSRPEDSLERTDGKGGFGMIEFVLVMGFFATSGWLVFHSCQLDRRKSILMLQVGLSGEARSLQRDLNQVAQTANTSTVRDFHHILTEATLALLRHPAHCVFGYSSVQQKQNIKSLEKCFNQLSLEEREKFSVETLVNINNMKVQRKYIPETNKLGKQFILVTILVAAEGTHKLPVIKDNESLKEALTYLGSINSRNIKAVNVLWSPQNENDALFEEELLENYPLLWPI